MRKLKLFENFWAEPRGGVIPYFKNGDEIEMMFYISSDPAYGGPKFQIGKGHIDNPSDIEGEAIREANEELGLKKSNIKRCDLAIKDKITGMAGTYEFYLFVAEVFNKDDFDKFGEEASEVGWLTMTKFKEIGRESQLTLVERCHDKITS